MNQGVEFFNFGERCVIKLFNAIYSLRKVYSGPIVVRQDVQSPFLDDIVTLFKPFNIIFDFFEMNSNFCNRNLSYSTKPRILQQSIFQYTMFCDSDTLFLSPINDFFKAIHENGIVLTKFNNWVSTGSIISKRIKRMSKFIDGDQLEQSLEHRPALNTGILGFDKDKSQEFFKEWIDITEKAKGLFIVDEIACQVMFFKHNCKVLGPEWNCSVIYGDLTDAKILHFHGKKNSHQDFFGARLWWASLYWAMQDGYITNDQIYFWAGKDKRSKRFLENGNFNQIKETINEYERYK